MSNEFENSNIDIEQLLRSKSWQQLSEREKEEVLNFVSGEAEYARMQNMTTQLMSEAGLNDDELKPSASLKANLMDAFADEQKKRRALWWHSLRYRLNDLFRFDIPVVRIAVVGVILILAVFGAVNLLQDKTTPVVVKNDQVAPVDNNVEPKVVESDQRMPNVDPNAVPGNSVGDDSVVGDEVVVSPLVVDTSNALVFTNNIAPFFVDTSANQTPYNIATSNGVVYTNNSYNTNLNIQNILPVNAGLPERARTLESDAQVLDVFFAVK